MTNTITGAAVESEQVRALRQAGRKVAEWTEQRDRLIREARAAGATFREIGEAVGMSHTAVKFICDGRP